MKRRTFLKQALSVSGALAAGGCISLPEMNSGYVDRKGKSMAGFRAPPMEKVRIGVIGLGHRGSGAIPRLAMLPNAEILALCDLIEDRVARQAKFLTEKGRPQPKCYAGSAEIWKTLCEQPDLDLIYICTPWLCHTPMAVHAMQCGKHAVTEVPAAVTVEQCWQLVDTSESTRKHFMMLENCCYGENELFALNLCRKGILGELVHGEGAYIHDLRASKWNAEQTGGYQGQWRLAWSQQHTGNPYPTHGLGPVCRYLDINRGDRMMTLTSMSSDPVGLARYAANKQIKATPIRQGDMNCTLIRTYRGRTILVQHDTTSPRPYSRLNLISGTKGCVADYPLRVALEPNAHQWMSAEELAKLKAAHAHPLWQKQGELARKQGGHGGMDFLMDYRLCHCLTQGLPLDMDVYDAASWSCLVELTETSVLKGGTKVDIPDFTRRGWITAARSEV